MTKPMSAELYQVILHIHRYYGGSAEAENKMTEAIKQYGQQCRDQALYDAVTVVLGMTRKCSILGKGKALEIAKVIEQLKGATND